MEINLYGKHGRGGGMPRKKIKGKDIKMGLDCLDLFLPCVIFFSFFCHLLVFLVFFHILSKCTGMRDA